MNNNLLKFLFILFITINTAGATGLQWFGPAPKIGCINSMKQFFISGPKDVTDVNHNILGKEVVVFAPHTSDVSGGAILDISNMKKHMLAGNLGVRGIVVSIDPSKNVIKLRKDNGKVVELSKKRSDLDSYWSTWGLFVLPTKANLNPLQNLSDSTSIKINSLRRKANIAAQKSDLPFEHYFKVEISNLIKSDSSFNRIHLSKATEGLSDRDKDFLYFMYISTKKRNGYESTEQIFEALYLYRDIQNMLWRKIIEKNKLVPRISNKDLEKTKFYSKWGNDRELTTIDSNDYISNLVSYIFVSSLESESARPIKVLTAEGNILELSPDQITINKVNFADKYGFKIQLTEEIYLFIKNNHHITGDNLKVLKKVLNTFK